MVDQKIHLGLLMNLNERKDRMGRVQLCVSNRGFQRNACEPVCRTSMNYIPSRLNFFPGGRIIMLECIGC